MINRKNLERLQKPDQPLSGGFSSNRCNQCGHEFTLNIRLERNGLLSWLSSKKCPKCGSKDIRVTGLVQK